MSAQVRYFAPRPLRSSDTVLVEEEPPPSSSLYSEDPPPYDSLYIKKEAQLESQNNILPV